MSIRGENEDIHSIQRGNTHDGRPEKEGRRNDRGWEKCKWGEKTDEYLRILVCVSSLQLMWSQEDSLPLFCSKTKPGLMRVSVISDWLSMGLLGAGCRDREEEKGQLD